MYFWAFVIEIVDDERKSKRTATCFENDQGDEYDSVTNRQRLAAQQAFPFLNLLEMRAYSTVECIAMALPALKQAQLSPQAPSFCHPNTSPPP